MKRCICARSHYGAGGGGRGKTVCEQSPCSYPTSFTAIVCLSWPPSEQPPTHNSDNSRCFFNFYFSYTVSNFASKDTKGRECGCSRLFFGGRTNRRKGPRAGSDRGGENFSPFDHTTINIFRMLFYSYKCFFKISSKTLTPGFQTPHSKLESKVPEYGFAKSPVVTGFPTAAPRRQA